MARSLRLLTFSCRIPFLYNGIAYLEAMMDQEKIEKRAREEEKLKKEKEKSVKLNQELLYGTTPKKPSLNSSMRVTKTPSM